MAVHFQEGQIMIRYQIRINEETQRVTFEGISWGYGLGNTLLLWEYRKHTGLVVVKKPGASDWSSRGQSSYGPAEFMVLRITDRLGAGHMRAETIISFPIRKPQEQSS